jgi:hypothetical protein
MRVLTMACSRVPGSCSCSCSDSCSRRAGARGPWPAFNRQDDYQVAECEHFRVYFTPQNQHRGGAAAPGRADPAAPEPPLRLSPGAKINVVVVGYTHYSNGFADLAAIDHDLRDAARLSQPQSGAVARGGLHARAELHPVAQHGARTPSHAPLVLSTGLARSTNGQALVRLPIMGSTCRTG